MLSSPLAPALYMRILGCLCSEAQDVSILIQFLATPALKMLLKPVCRFIGSVTSSLWDRILPMPGTWAWCLLATIRDGKDWTQEAVPGWQSAEIKSQSCASFLPAPTPHCHVPISIEIGKVTLRKEWFKTRLRVGVI